MRAAGFAARSYEKGQRFFGMSVHGAILRRCLMNPLRVSVIDDRRSWRAGEILIGSLRLAAELEGICRSKTLGIMLPTGAGFPIAALAGWMLGRAIVPLNYLLKEEELNAIVRHCGCDTIVTASALLSHMKFEPVGVRLLRLDTFASGRRDGGFTDGGVDGRDARPTSKSPTSKSPTSESPTRENQAELQHGGDWAIRAADILRGQLSSVIPILGGSRGVTSGLLSESTGSHGSVSHAARRSKKNRVRLPRQIRQAGTPAPQGEQHGAPGSADDLAALLYTSGTSGVPKGVMLTHANLEANMHQIQSWVSFTRRDVIFGVLPQFHSFGFTVLTLLPLTIGCKVVYSARFVPTRIVKLLHQHRPTVLVAIPSMYGALLSVKGAGAGDFSSLRLTVSGGEPLPRTVRDRFVERFGKEICEGYGLTETAPVTHWRRPGEGEFGTVGKALPGVEVRIVSLHSGDDLGPNEEGEIRLRGPNIMIGYSRDRAATNEAFDEQGFFRTGDIGRVDAAGFLSITGRLKEMMIVGGENVFPREIEEVIERHPSVRASGVIGAPHPMRGEEPIAFVELNDGCQFNEAELRAWCRTQIATYKTPGRIYCVDELPKGPTGKVLRRALRGCLPDEGLAKSSKTASGRESSPLSRGDGESPRT